MAPKQERVVDKPADICHGTSTLLEDLVFRCKTLLTELEAFRSHLRALRQEGNIEIGHFRVTLQSELNMLGRYCRNGAPDLVTAEVAPDTHVARSSNIPFLEAVWKIAKGSNEVTALHKRVYTTPDVKRLSQGMRHVDLNGASHPAQPTSDGHKQRAEERCVVVDAIVDSGRTWIKVSLVTNRRLLFDLAKQGWDSGASDDDDDDDTMSSTNHDSDSGVPLVRTAKELMRAAQYFRVRTKRPQVHLVLPRIQSGVTPEIDSILDICRAVGVFLHCGEESSSLLPLEKCLSRMAPDPLASFTETLNVDCTLLLALVSEISHGKVYKEPWFNTALSRQVEIEGKENMLPNLLYPAMVGHRLVCTMEAAKRMQEIVESIGTPSEKARTAILMGAVEHKTQADLVNQMQEWSAYEVPYDWQLPIKVVDQNENDCQSDLPTVAKQVCAGMTAINTAVFLHGWARGYTTITSNRTVLKQIENGLEKFESLGDTVWPRVWLCPQARSLVGKEKRGAKKGDSNKDMLRREVAETQWANDSEKALKSSTSSQRGTKTRDLLQ